MNKKQRVVLASRLRQFSELGRAGVSTKTALGAAAADNPATGLKIGVQALPASFDDFLPESMPHTRALLATAGKEESGVIAGAAADLLDEPGSQAPGWSTMTVSIVGAGVVVIAISIFVMPVFKDVFESFGADLPALTVLTFFLAKWVFAPLGAVLLLLVLARTIWTLRPVLLGSLTTRIDALLMKLPLIGQVTRANETKKLAFWLAANGIGGDMKRRLDCLMELAGQGQFSRQVGELSGALQGGKTLIDATAAPAWLPGFAMVLGDAANDGDADSAATRKKLFAYASGLDARSDSLIARLTLIAHIFIGVVVGFFVVAMYLPIFKMGSSI